MADIFGIGQMGSAAMNIGANAIFTQYNNQRAAEREQAAREQNYEFGELAAQNAHLRTQDLYNKLYSPSAQLRQLKEAGLSPSLFYGDGGGISGQAGAQGTGAAGVNPNVFGVPNADIGSLAMNMAQIEQIRAATENTKADTAKKQEETQGVELENARKKLENSKIADEYEVLSAWYANEDGSSTSLTELAERSETFDEFLQKARTFAKDIHNTDTYGKESELQRILTTENGVNALRNIYRDAYKVTRDIADFTRDQVDAEFAIKITNALSSSDYADQNAKTLVAKLRAENVEANLTDDQKGAFDRIIRRFENGSSRDLAVVLLTLIAKAYKYK